VHIVQALVEAGIDTFFGVPGGPVAPVCNAILDHEGATFVEARHETSAAFAAATYHRVSGRVPAVVVTAGPGATNVVTGVANAHLARVPMVIVCGDVATFPHGKRLLQDMGAEGLDIEHMLRRLVRASIRVVSPQAAASQAAAAIEAATNPSKPGPALLVVPLDHGRTEVEEQAPVIRSERCHQSVIPEAAIQTTASWLSRAKRPLIVLGAGCIKHAKLVRQLVDALNVPFVTTPQAKGVVSEAHPRCLCNGGMAASHWARRYTERGVDVALVLGTDLDDVSIGPTPYCQPGGKLIHVDLDATVFHRNLKADLAIVGDLSVFCRDLVRHALEEGKIQTRGRDLMLEVRSASPFDVADAGEDDSETITPHRAVMDLERAAGLDAMFITDIGEHMLFALHYLTARTPESFHIQLGLGSMGSGIAGAIGLALGKPGKRVVCISGDGGMHMTGMEMLVAADRGLPIVYAVFNDARYNMVYHGMKQIFGRGAAWETPWVDFAAWSRAMGVPAVRINHPGEITAELLDSFSENGPGPMLLDIRIDREVRIRGGGARRSSSADVDGHDRGGAMKATISGMDTWLPATVRTNETWPLEFIEAARARGDRTLVDIPQRDLDECDRICARYLVEEGADPFIGAVERRVAQPHEAAWYGEAEAGRAALEDAGVDPMDVDAVISWALVSDRAGLPSATRVAHEIGARRAWATGADSGCASALVQLELAMALVESGRARHVLLTQSHLILPAFPLAHPASPGVGDACTAWLVSATESPGIVGIESVSHGEYWDSVTWIRGRDDASDTPWWEPGGPFLPGSRNTEGAKTLMRDTVRFGARTVEEACERFRVPVSSIDCLVAVQPRKWIPRAIAETLGLDPDIAPDTFDSLAHVGGCGVVTNLMEARRRGLLAPGATVAIYAQGAGFTRSAAIMRC